ncbi:MAG: sigma-70 family RNA polymerase sigma factor [Chitinispirillaceae bacterium]|nr:sigma-70 family RNA polymerase sigma factor [Chitinispirillaceae bacterium]
MKVTRGKENEVRILYERYASMVFRRCRMFLKSEDEAWDATQEVFMKLMRSLDTITKKDSIYSWLLSASTNHCISQLRKKRHESFDEEYHGASPSTGGLPQERRMVLDEIMRYFLSPWDEKIRQIIIYTYIDGYKQEEISRLTGMGESTIRRHLTRFKRESAASLLKREDLI